MKEKSNNSPRNGATAIILNSCLPVALIIASALVAPAQQLKNGTRIDATPTIAAPIPSESDGRYRMGPGDVLDIRVFNRPQLSRDAVRVDARGMIRMPLIQGEIQAACRTESELSKDIATRYLEYLRDPHVDVFIKEYQSQPVAVIGAANAPGRFQLQRRVRLLELMSFAGGPTERSGGRIQITHATDVSLCDAQKTGAVHADNYESSDVYSLSDVLRNDEKSNPFVRAGDIITVLEAEKVYVVGNVLRPSAIPIKEPITVSRAIAIAGGTMPDTKSDKVRIIRQVPGSAAKTEIFVDLKAIDKRRSEDLVLEANDIVDVPTSSGRRFLRGIVGAVAPAISNLPVRVIR